MIETGTLDRIQAVMDNREPDGLQWASIRHIYVLRGERGAVQFVYFDWGPGATDEVRAIDTKFMIQFGHPMNPMPVDVGYHTPAPMNTMQVELGVTQEHCEWIGGPCYTDGSSLRAQMLMTRWVQADRDDEVIWSALHEYYLARFHADEIPTVAESIEDLDFSESLMLVLGAIAAAHEEEDET